MATNKLKNFHFIGYWANGDKMAVSSYGKNKKDAWLKTLKARKEGKFQYRKGDNFWLKYRTEEETERVIAKKYGRNIGKIFSKHGHTCYIVKDGKVYIN